VLVLDADGERREIPAAELGFKYRCSCFKEQRPERPGRVILATELVLYKGLREEIKRIAEEITLSRKRTQPLQYPSAGSVFKNPLPEYAGRLIEVAGLKGVRVGDAQVSPKHANFIVNRGSATATDVLELIELIRDKIRAQFHQELDLEIVYIGRHIHAVRSERKAGEDEPKARTGCCSSMRSVLR
jgi:UDP-N-acetylmuramate dehydrogenase